MHNARKFKTDVYKYLLCLPVNTRNGTNYYLMNVAVNAGACSVHWSITELLIYLIGYACLRIKPQNRQALIIHRE